MPILWVLGRGSLTRLSQSAALLPHSGELMALASYGIFSMHYLEDEVSGRYREVGDKL